MKRFRKPRTMTLTMSLPDGREDVDCAVEYEIEADDPSCGYIGGAAVESIKDPEGKEWLGEFDSTALQTIESRVYVGACEDAETRYADWCDRLCDEERDRRHGL